MKITKNQLKQIIMEELGRIKGREWIDDYADNIKRIVKLAAADGHDVGAAIAEINILATTVKRAGIDLPPASNVDYDPFRDERD
tara:strand:- start:247 stop:498 length:252 start_codon:yes stop_codon:yes gene_type:complete